MDDLIKRQDAIDACFNGKCANIYDCKEAIEKIPSAQKIGKWKEVYAESDYRNGWIECTCENCEYQHGFESGQYGWHYGDDIPWKYCPICGAKMEVTT